VQPNDAEANLFGSINIAGHFEIPEVCVFFNGWLTRGNRTTKFDAMSYKAFMSHNYPPLGEFHAKVEINWALVRTAAEVEHRSHPFQVKRLLTEGVAVLRMFPGISAHFVRKCLEAPLRGCVLTTFGQGNVYSREPGILQAIEEAAARGLLIVNVTQCPRGTVTASYVTGRVLTNIGVESGHDMTVESALAKMGFLLSEVDAGTYTHEQARAMLSKPLRGELTSPVEVQQFSFRDQNFVQAFAQSMEKMIAPGSDSLSGRLQGIASALFGVVSQYGDVPAMESVWRSGANVDAVDGDGRTALHTSVIRKRLDVVRFLVDVAKCDLNIVDETPGFGLTPLDHALIHGSMEIAEYLRNKGALQAYMIKK
jgi:60kDa lysophospholipase